MSQKVEVECDYCGEKLRRYPCRIEKNNHHFCSHDCHNKWMKKNNCFTKKNNPRWKGGEIKKECEYCGKEFEVKQKRENTARFCSHECKGNWQSEEQVGKNNPRYNRVKVECDYCGNTIEIKPHNYNRYDHHFCDLECDAKWRSVNLSGQNASGWKGGKVEIECKYCEEIFKVDPHRKDEAKFCSRKCIGKWLSENNSGEDNPRWKENTVNKLYYGSNWRKKQRKIRKRDNYSCQLCGAEEDGRKHNIHHIDKFRKFGIENYKEANKDSNLITLCASCHRKAESGKVSKKELRGLI